MTEHLKEGQEFPSGLGEKASAEGGQSPRGVEQQACLEKGRSSDVAVRWAGAQPRTMAGKDPGETGKSGLGRARVPG